jgi:hypothetical protein
MRGDTRVMHAVEGKGRRLLGIAGLRAPARLMDAANAATDDAINSVYLFVARFALAVRFSVRPLCVKSKF